jgi:hypothetical protein
VASFSDTSFDTSAFSVGAFDFGSTPPTPPADVVIAQIVGGGIPAHGTLRLRGREGRSRADVARDRERFGIKAAAVIAAVAERQAERLEGDEQKRFDELLRELQLREIEWDARYLEAMNLQRQSLIDAEIGRLLQIKNDEEIVMLMMLAACV